MRSVLAVSVLFGLLGYSCSAPGPFEASQHAAGWASAAGLVVLTWVKTWRFL